MNILTNAAEKKYRLLCRWFRTLNLKSLVLKGYIHVRSDAPTTEQYQSQQSAVFNRYMRRWPRIYGPALLIFLNVHLLKFKMMFSICSGFSLFIFFLEYSESFLRHGCKICIVYKRYQRKEDYVKLRTVHRIVLFLK